MADLIAGQQAEGTLHVVITRADGTVEDLGDIGATFERVQLTPSDDLPAE